MLAGVVPGLPSLLSATILCDPDASPSSDVVELALAGTCYFWTARELLSIASEKTEE